MNGPRAARNCNCLPPCSRPEHMVDVVQYGHLNGQEKDNHDGPDMKDVSFIMYPTSITEVEYEEVPEYEFSKLLSDIGGTAGLILGISVSTVLAYLDKFLVYVIPRLVTVFRSMPIRHLKFPSETYFFKISWTKPVHVCKIRYLK